MPYFACEITKSQKSQYTFWEIGLYLDYYILYVEEKDILHMDIRDLDIVPISEQEAKSYAFCNTNGKEYLKVPENSWEILLFDREKKESYEKLDKERIKYIITDEDKKYSLSLMKKILDKKTKVFIENRIIFDKDNYKYWNDLYESLSNELNNCITIKEATDYFLKIQSKLYKEHPEDWE